MEVSKGGRYRHHSGRLYTVVEIANTYAPSEKFPRTVVYRSGTGEVWSRPMDQFVKKFTRVDHGPEMVGPTVFYVCDDCADHSPETCGFPNITDLSLSPDGRFLCSCCADEDRLHQEHRDQYRISGDDD